MAGATVVTVYPSNRGVGTGMSTDHVRPSSRGWGFAALIIALAIVANITAYSIHKATYLKPDKARTAVEAPR